jgi:UDP-N-acetylglucosamine 2-epimerase (non-hydrolysing)
MVVFGTRPEAIKLAPVIKALESVDGRCETRVCLSAQHRQMLDQVLGLFEIEAHWDLDIMTPGQDLTGLTSKVLCGVGSVIDEWKPHMVVVQGDTTTTFAASLAAFYRKVDVAHVEAGLRTHRRYSPWPEEMNRCLTSVLATHHFAPTETSRSHLRSEGIAEDRIWVTGNTVIDALLSTVRRLHAEDDRNRAIHQEFGFLKADHRMILVTGHRRESFGAGFENICRALKGLAERPDIQIVYPVHLNPNVQEPVYELLSNLDNVFLLEPLAYERFVWMMDRSYLILTDSGGIQEEAPSLGKPVLVMRDTTERPEAVQAGTSLLVGTDCEKIVNSVNTLLDSRDQYEAMAQAHNPYGDGRASQRIVREIVGDE